MAWDLDEFRKTPAGRRNAAVLDNAFTKGKPKASTRAARDRIQAAKAKRGASVSGEIHDENQFFDMLREAGIQIPKTEWQFSHGYNDLGHPEKFRADYFWSDYGLLLEVQGGVFMMGGHSGGEGQLKDFVKFNRAAEAGYRVLQYTPQQLCREETIEQIRIAILGGGDMPAYSSTCNCDCPNC